MAMTVHSVINTKYSFHLRSGFVLPSRMNMAGDLRNLAHRGGNVKCKPEVLPPSAAIIQSNLPGKHAINQFGCRRHGRRERMLVLNNSRIHPCHTGPGQPKRRHVDVYKDSSRKIEAFSLVKLMLVFCVNESNTAWPDVPVRLLCSTNEHITASLLSS